MEAAAAGGSSAAAAAAAGDDDAATAATATFEAFVSYRQRNEWGPPVHAPLRVRGRGAGITAAAAQLMGGLDSSLAEVLATAGAQRPRGQPRLDELFGDARRSSRVLACCSRGCMSKLWFGSDHVDEDERLELWDRFGQLNARRRANAAEKAREEAAVSDKEPVAAGLRRPTIKAAAPKAGFEKSLAGGYVAKPRSVDELPDRSAKALVEGKEVAQMEQRLRTQKLRSSASDLSSLERSFAQWLCTEVKIGGQNLCVYGTRTRQRQRRRVRACFGDAGMFC
eukprot:COSAG01_NODE_13025_length_1648_cov_1.238864_1_plen_281_part_00